MIYIVYYRHKNTTHWDQVFFKTRSNADKQIAIFLEAGGEVRLETHEFQDKFDS